MTRNETHVVRLRAGLGIAVVAIQIDDSSTFSLPLVVDQTVTPHGPTSWTVPTSWTRTPRQA